jgi:hypothetical protein
MDSTVLGTERPVLGIMRALQLAVEPTVLPSAHRTPMRVPMHRVEVPVAGPVLGIEVPVRCRVLSIEPSL